MYLSLLTKGLCESYFPLRAACEQRLPDGTCHGSGAQERRFP